MFSSRSYIFRFTRRCSSLNDPVCLFKTTHEDKIGVLSFNRPKQRNALSLEMIKLLHTHLDTVHTLAHKSDLRALLICSKEPKMFCAGADLKERSSMSQDEARQLVKGLIQKTASLLTSIPIATVAAIEGAAVGGGLEIALACDIRIASANAKLGLVETAVGVIPGAGGTQTLPRVIGEARAKEMIMMARILNGKEAESWGLVNRCVEEGTTFDVALDVCKRIASLAPLAVRASKRAIEGGRSLNLKDGLKLEFECYETILGSKDRTEGLQAFLEKRTPVYKGE